MKKNKYIWLFVLTALYSQTLLFSAKGQSFDPLKKFDVTLLKDSLNVNVGQYCFNNIVVSNLIDQSVELGLRMELPQGWSILSNLPSGISIAPGQVKNIPFRIKVGSKAFGGQTYIIRIYLDDPISGKTVTSYVQMHVKSQSNWKAFLNTPEIISSESEALPDFKLSLKNTGNKPELFEISFNSNVRLTLPGSGTQVLLKPGEDTILTVGVRSRFLNEVEDQILIEIQSRGKKEILRQRILFMTSVYKPNESKYESYDINVSLNSSNILNPNSNYFYLQSDSYLEFTKDLSLMYRYRYNGIKNYQNNSQHQAFAAIRYKNFKVGGGFMQNFLYGNYSGNGVMAEYKSKNAFYSAQVVRNSKFSNTFYTLDGDQQISKSISTGIQAQFNDNTNTGSRNAFGIYQVTLSNSKNFNVKFDAGYCSESMSFGKAKENGLVKGYNVDYATKRFRVHSNFIDYSGHFPGIFRGLMTYNHQLHLFAGSFSLGGFYSKVNRAPSYFNTTSLEFKDYNSFTQDEMGAILSSNRIKNISLRVSKFNLEQRIGNKATMSGYKGMLSLQNNKSKFNYLFQLSATTSEYTSFENDNINLSSPSFSAFFRGRSKRLSFHLRYEYGPNYFYDYLYYLSQGYYISKGQLSLNYQLISKNNFYWNSGISYYKFNGLASANVNLSNRFHLNLPNRGLGISVTMNNSLINRSSEPYINISLDKTLGIPFPFHKKYKSARMVFFKDKNYNNKQDKDEEPVRNAQIIVNNRNMITDHQGAISLINIPAGVQVIEYDKINNQKGWTPGVNAIKDSLKVDRDIQQAIPFTKSKYISGIVDVQLAKNSLNVPPSLAGIIVSIINSDGTEHKAISNAKGEFLINLATGTYEIVIPKGILGKDFYLENNGLSVDLTNSEGEEVKLTIKERERKINIRRID